MQLILCGGGSGNQNTLANQKLNEIIDHKRPILYIPLAMNEEEHSYDSCYEWIQGELANVDILYIEMVRTFEELASKDLKHYAALFIGGGNTYKLLLGLKQSGARNNIRNYINNDGIVIGGSAGAVIFGYDINIIASMDRNDVNLTDTRGFDVLSGISIFPHYTNKKSKLTDDENEERLNAKDVIKMATINGAKALQKEDEIGSIEEGKVADIILVDISEKLDNITMVPNLNKLANLVYNTSGRNVDTTIVNGNVLMENRIIKNINVQEVINKCNKIIKRLF